jgi:hypothetical protein
LNNKEQELDEKIAYLKDLINTSEERKDLLKDITDLKN